MEGMLSNLNLRASELFEDFGDTESVQKTIVFLLSSIIAIIYIFFYTLVQSRVDTKLFLKINLVLAAYLICFSIRCFLDTTVFIDLVIDRNIFP